MDISLSAPFAEAVNGTKGLKMTKVKADEIVNAVNSEETEAGMVKVARETIRKYEDATQPRKTAGVKDSTIRLRSRLEEDTKRLNKEKLPMVEPLASDWRVTLTSLITAAQSQLDILGSEADVAA
jgi:hypothetical protein